MAVKVVGEMRSFFKNTVRSFSPIKLSKPSRIIRESDFIIPKNSNRFIGGITGRSGTTWLMQLLADLLFDEYFVIGEHGTFALSQFRNAGYEYYQVTPGNARNRKSYLNFFYEFVMTKAYDRHQIYGEGLNGLRSIVPKIAIQMAFDALERELEHAWTLQECNVSLGNFYCRLLNYHVLQNGGTVNWISKEPPYGRHLKDLYSMCPDGRVVIMVRDGRDVALSIAKRGWCNGDIIHSINRWKDFAQMMLDSLDNVPNNNYLLIRYEDLTLQFKEKVQEILSFYGIDTTSRIADLINSDNYEYAPLANNFGKWKDELSEDARAHFKKTCGVLMERLGYEV